MQCVSNNKIKLNNKLENFAIYTTIRSLNKNFDELEEIIKEKNEKPTSTSPSETWFLSDCLLNLYKLSGYIKVISESTKKSNVAAIFVDETVAYEVIPLFHFVNYLTL